METSSPREGWAHAFRHDPALFDDFRNAEDPEHRILARLRARLDLAGRDVLEVGCGTGRVTEVLAPLARLYVALDVAAPMLERARARLEPTPGLALVRARAQQLPFREASVDIVVATWVFANLRPTLRERAVTEAHRVLRDCSDAGIWLVENHWQSELQELRGLPSDESGSEVGPLIADSGFELVEEIDTEIRFATPGEAARVLGALCGEGAAAELARRPRNRIGQRVVILHRPRTTLRCRS